VYRAQTWLKARRDQRAGKRACERTASTATLPIGMRSRALLLAPLVVGLLAIPSPLRAQQAGFALDRFEPSERGSEWFAHDTLDLRGKLRPAIGVVGSWAYKPLVVYAPDGDERTAIVRHQLVLHPGASLVVADRLRFAFDVPIAAYQ
jgi:OmpA-OmpF porin, OOP family